MYSVFDGGLSVQEYEVNVEATPPSLSSLTTEFIRGEGMGGGVGGMVYSIKNGGIICSHANHRGDIIARSDSTGSLTSFALYEAYGTRPYQWGSDPDRQKANTKEEESDLGLLNEGMRPRDLETGTFLTRDPTGYADGPNIYCYVHCNPITRFDLFGLLSIAIYDGSDRGWGSGTANRRDYKAAAKSSSDIQIDASSVQNATEQIRELINSGVIDEEITEISIFDHGGAGVQTLGDSGLPTGEIMVKGAKETPLADLGSLTSEDAVINLMGCKVGQDEEYVEDLADAFGRTTTAATGDTEYERKVFGLVPTGKVERTGDIVTKEPETKSETAPVPTPEPEPESEE